MDAGRISAPVRMAVNRNTGGILLTSDHGRVTDLLPLRVDDGVFGRYWDATPVWGAVFLAALDDPSKPCPDWDGRVEGVREYAEDPFDERDTRSAASVSTFTPCRPRRSARSPAASGPRTSVNTAPCSTGR